jgi:hypothetical protein
MRGVSASGHECSAARPRTSIAVLVASANGSSAHKHFIMRIANKKIMPRCFCALYRLAEIVAIGVLFNFGLKRLCSKRNGSTSDLHINLYTHLVYMYDASERLVGICPKWVPTPWGAWVMGSHTPARFRDTVYTIAPAAC